MKKLWIFLIFLMLLIIVFVVSYIRVTHDLERAISNYQAPTVNLNSVENGTYEGDYSLFPVFVAVEVEVLDHEILSIDLIKHQNGQGEKGEVVLQEILEKNDLEVDVFTGATISSISIVKAVEDALTK